MRSGINRYLDNLEDGAPGNGRVKLPAAQAELQGRPGAEGDYGW